MQTERSFTPMGDRYEFDFKKCTASNGWAQLDTKQDASYYGNWVNPISFELVSYCEGDITHKRCTDAEEFRLELLIWIGWQREREYFIGIDGMCDERLIAAFKQLGFEAELH